MCDEVKWMKYCEDCKHCELDPSGNVRKHYCNVYGTELANVGLIDIKYCDDYCKGCEVCRQSADWEKNECILG